MKYNISEINRNFLIKIFGRHDGRKVNTLVGVEGLIRFVGIDYANKFVTRAFNCDADVCVCKVRNGLQVSFYAH